MHIHHDVAGPSSNAPHSSPSPLPRSSSAAPHAPPTTQAPPAQEDHEAGVRVAATPVAHGRVRVVGQDDHEVGARVAATLVIAGPTCGSPRSPGNCNRALLEGRFVVATFDGLAVEDWSKDGDRRARACDSD
jgi:hypothetical protein